jgi:multiple sugar transport system substrate-binding protein/raffinose/stachyose/melibiose transport system substrate-binding protein
MHSGLELDMIKPAKPFPATSKFVQPGPAMLVLAGTILLVAALSAACTGKETPAAAGIQRVSFLHYFSGSLSGGIDELVTTFNNADPLFRLAATPLDHESFKTGILDSLSQGDPPDIYSYWAGAKTREIIAELEPLDTLWSEAGLDRYFPQSLVDSASIYEGKHYLLPITQHLVGFFYNKKVFETAGIQPPEDWESFLVACAALKKAGYIPIALGSRDKWPAQFWFDYLLTRTASPEYRQHLMDGTASWTDPEVKNTFARWAELLAEDFFNPKPNEASWDSDAGGMVVRGEAGMTLMGTWIMGAWRRLAPEWEAGRDYGFFPFPVLDPAIPYCAIGPVDGLVVPRLAGNIPGAMKVLEFLAGAEPQALMARGSGAIAPNASVPVSTYEGLGEQILDMIHKAEHWAFNYDLATHPVLSEIGLSLFVDFLEFPAYHPQLLKQTQERMTKAYGSLGL